MRRLAMAAAACALLAPALARADLRLSLNVVRCADAERAAHAALDVPPLHLDAALARDAGGGEGYRRGRVEPVVSLVLGIIPGFGLGHYLAGAPFQTWLVVDVALLAAVIVASVLDGGVLVALVWGATFVERVFEGIDAYRAAGGRLSSRDGPPPDVRLAATSAVPVVAPGPGPERAVAFLGALR